MLLNIADTNGTVDDVVVPEQSEKYFFDPLVDISYDDWNTCCTALQQLLNRYYYHTTTCEMVLLMRALHPNWDDGWLFTDTVCSNVLNVALGNGNPRQKLAASRAVERYRPQETKGLSEKIWRRSQATDIAFDHSMSTIKEMTEQLQRLSETLYMYPEMLYGYELPTFLREYIKESPEAFFGNNDVAEYARVKAFCAVKCLAPEVAEHVPMANTLLAAQKEVFDLNVLTEPRDWAMYAFYYAALTAQRVDLTEQGITMTHPPTVPERILLPEPARFRSPLSRLLNVS